MGAKDRQRVTTETLQPVLDGVAEWIRFADAKAGAVLTVDGVLLALFQARLRSVPRPGVIATGSLWFATAVAALSGLFAIWTVIPRVVRLRPVSVMHYGHIASFGTAAEYLAAVQVVFSEPERLETAMVEYIWTLSQAAARKYMFVSWSIRSLILAFVFGVSALLWS